MGRSAEKTDPFHFPTKGPNETCMIQMLKMYIWLYNRRLPFIIPVFKLRYVNEQCKQQRNVRGNISVWVVRVCRKTCKDATAFIVFIKTIFLWVFLWQALFHFPVSQWNFFFYMLTLYPLWKYFTIILYFLYLENVSQSTFYLIVVILSNQLFTKSKRVLQYCQIECFVNLVPN